MIRKIFCIALCALAVLSCTEESPEIKKNVCSIETGDAFDITPFSAKLLAQFNMGSFMVDVNTRTIYCSTDPNPGKDNCLTNYYEDWGDGRSFWYFSRLQPNTTYYYRAYLDYEYLFESEILLGKVKSFTTQAIEGGMVTTLDPLVNSYNLILRGRVAEALRSYGGYSLWFEYEVIDQETGERSITYRGDANSQDDGTFECYISKGSVAYRACLSYMNIEYRGEEKTWNLNL